MYTKTYIFLCFYVAYLVLITISSTNTLRVYASFLGLYCFGSLDACYLKVEVHYVFSEALHLRCYTLSVSHPKTDLSKNQRAIIMVDEQSYGPSVQKRHFSKQDYHKKFRRFFGVK